MSEIKRENRIKLKTENLGAVKAPQAHITTKLYADYTHARREKDRFIRQAQEEINRDIKKKKDSEIAGMASSCLGVMAVYLGIKFRTNLGYFKNNILNLLKRKS